MKKILIVDDEPDVVELVRNRLEANNFEVIAAINGQDGVKAAQQQRPDLIIMDVMMPGLTGGDAVRLLRAEDTTRNIPLIFLTAVAEGLPRNDEEEVNINVDETFYSTIAKPFKSEILLREIRRLLGDG